MNKKFIIGLIILSVCLFLATSVYSFRQAAQNIDLPIVGKVNDFQLIDVNGKELTLVDLRHKVWVVNFFFSTCSDICPMMTKNMAALHRSYKMLDDVAFVSITVNPENDSPSTLGEYAKKYQADTAQWHFLTGSREAITELMVRNFKLGSSKEPIFHSSKFVLVDRKGQIRGYYDGTSTEDVQKLFRNIAILIKEKHQ